MAIPNSPATLSAIDAYTNDHVDFAPTSGQLRVFTFKNCGGCICIDFTWHPVEPGWLYIVPAHHRIYMPGRLWKDCVCRELDQEALPEGAQIRLLRLHYVLQKRSPTLTMCDLQSAETVARDISSLATAANGQEAHIVCRASSLLDYHEVALRFLQFVQFQKPSQKLAVNSDGSIGLCHQQRKVRRACLETFGVPPVTILRYHVVLEAVRLLAETNCKISDVADRLEFSDGSKCTRFLKDKLGICPLQFRRLVRQLNGKASD